MKQGKVHSRETNIWTKCATLMISVDIPNQLMGQQFRQVNT